MTPGDIHKRILLALSRGEHWGNWYAFSTANVLPAAARSFLVRKGLAISQWNIGSFSNLGEWDPNKQFDGPGVAGVWLFCPPALRTQFVAAGCLTFQGKLSITVQAHPELTTCTEIVERWVTNWAKAVHYALEQCTRLPPSQLSESEAREYWLRM